MRFEDERYIRSYTRDTVAWKMLPWESKCLLALLFRKVDRVGLLDVGDYGTEGIAAIVDLPVQVVEAGLPSLLDRKMAQWTGDNHDVLFIPNFLEAQEAHTSDVQRKRDQRERATARARLQAMGLEAPPSRGVTIGHEAGQEVTDGHTESLRAEPSRADLIQPTQPTQIAQNARARVDRHWLVEKWGAWGTRVLLPDARAIDEAAVLIERYGRAKGVDDLSALAENMARAFVDKVIPSWSFVSAGTPQLFVKHFELVQAALEGVQLGQRAGPRRRGDNSSNPETDALVRSKW